ncbi:MAG: helix-turn-helix domain-containing protein [Anaerolineae bacterium]|nr:helix-turn-helix domain-containing protein [Anaerolineae bacterium]
MSNTGLGVALRKLRERRSLSVREVGKLSEIDHAYVHRLETGEKTSPSQELIGKLLKVLKVNERDTTIVKWLADHPDTNPELVEYVLDDPSIEALIFTVAGGARYRGGARPDPATLIARVKRALNADDED